MQQNTNEIAAAPSIRSQEVCPQQQPTNSFPRSPCHPRFTLTPETMGLNLTRTDTSTHNRDQQQQQQQQHDQPLVDVKSYYERHNKQRNIGSLSDLQLEPNVSFHSSHSNTPTNSCASIKTETMRQRLASFPSTSKTDYLTQQTPSPSASPRSPTQQWNFDHTTKSENLEQQNTVYTSSALLYPTQSAQTVGKFPTGSSNLQTLSGEQNSSNTTQNSPSRTQCAYMQNATSLTEMPVLACYQQHRSGSDGCVGGDSAKLNFKELNDIYSKRIKNIDADVWGDKDLKIETYQEWIEMLTKINESFITNMDELEREVAERLKLMQSKVSSNCRHSQGNELMKCRKDIDTLIKYIQNARNYQNWDLQGITFETITPSQILDLGEFENLTIEDNKGESMKNCNDSEVMQRNKLFASLKALAHEVAEKHDEVRDLKRQVICLEDEIQKAQKKIQLKDDVIKELRNDLKCANNKFLNNLPLDTGLVMPPINFENQSSRSNNTQTSDSNTPTYHGDNGSQFDSLSQTELKQQQALQNLEHEINEFVEIEKECDIHKMEDYLKKLKGIVHRLQSEKDNADRRVNFILHQLVNLESDSADNNNADCDSGFHSKSENNQDAKILEAIRRRLRQLNELNSELKKKLQKLQLENSELSNSLHSEKSFAERNRVTLKEVADLLLDVTEKQFSYTDIYNTTSNVTNPFCEAIREIKDDFKEKESYLMKIICNKNKQIEELSTLLQNENEERTIHWNVNNLEDIKQTPTTTLTASQSQPPLPVTTESTTSSATPTTMMTGQQLGDKTSTLSITQDFPK